MIYTYKPSGVCSSNMIFTIDDDIIKDLVIERGCPGNALGIKELVKDQSIDNVIDKLEGIRCGGKSTSCPDQIAKALKEYKEKRNS